MASIQRAVQKRLRLDLVLSFLWILVLVDVAAPGLGLARPLSLILIAYSTLALVGLRWQSLLLCGVLAGLGLILCGVFDVWPAFLQGAGRALIFAAFMPTVLLVRATADRRSEIAQAKILFARLDPGQRGAGLLFGLHAIASILSIGIFAILASVVDPNEPEAERRRLVGIGLRSICLCAMWSPFFVGMGLATHFIPTVELWQIMPLGLSFAIAGLFLSVVMFDRSGGLSGLTRTLASLAPVLPPIAVAALSVVAITSLTDLATLQALVVTMPVLCGAALLSGGSGKFAAAIAATRAGLVKIRGEICILSFAVILGTVIEFALPVAGIQDSFAGLNPSPLVVIAFIIFAMSAAGLLGFHPIVSLTVLLALFSSVTLPVDDLVLMMALLMGWGFGAMISVSGISVVTASTMFAIAPERLIRGANILFVVVMGTAATGVLTGLNLIWFE